MSASTSRSATGTRSARRTASKNRLPVSLAVTSARHFPKRLAPWLLALHRLTVTRLPGLWNGNRPTVALWILLDPKGRSRPRSLPRHPTIPRLFSVARATATDPFALVALTASLTFTPDSSAWPPPASAADLPHDAAAAVAAARARRVPGVYRGDNLLRR